MFMCLVTKYYLTVDAKTDSWNCSLKKKLGVGGGGFACSVLQRDLLKCYEISFL